MGLRLDGVGGVPPLTERYVAHGRQMELFALLSLPKKASLAGMAEQFTRMLAARYGGSEAIAAGWWNARAVRVGGRACIAKLIPYVRGNEAWNAQQDRRFAMERYVYARLPPRWPVRLVDAFRSEVGPCIVTTLFENDGWRAYRPSVANDRAVARQLLAQVATLHRRGGVAHGDLELKNILFRAPARVVVIDFEKGARCRAGSLPQREDYSRLLAALLSDSRTHGVAFSVVEQLIRNGDLAAARAAFLVAAGRAGQLRGPARRARA